MVAFLVKGPEVFHNQRPFLVFSGQAAMNAISKPELLFETKEVVRSP
jgi:hypothetical protein